MLVSIPLAFVVLFLFHHAFPLLSTGERLLYAAMEAVPVALVIAWATENELRRRRDQADRESTASTVDRPERVDDGTRGDGRRG